MNCLSTFVLFSRNINISTQTFDFGYWKECCRIIYELLIKMGRINIFIVFSSLSFPIYNMAHVMSLLQNLSVPHYTDCIIILFIRPYNIIFTSVIKMLNAFFKPLVFQNNGKAEYFSLKLFRISAWSSNIFNQYFVYMHIHVAISDFSFNFIKFR